MLPTLANDPAIQAALILNDARRPRFRFKDKLLLAMPFLIGCHLLLKALLLAGDSATIDTIRGLEALEGFFCLYLSLRVYFQIRRAHKAD